MLDLILHVHMRLALTCRNGGRKNKDTHRGRITSYRIGYTAKYTSCALTSIFMPLFLPLLFTVGPTSIVPCVARLESICPLFSLILTWLHAKPDAVTERNTHAHTHTHTQGGTGEGGRFLIWSRNVIDAYTRFSGKTLRIEHESTIH